MTSPFLKQVKEIEETGRPTLSPDEYLQLRLQGFSDEDIRNEADVLDPPPEHPLAALWEKVGRPALHGLSQGTSDEIAGAVNAAGAVLPGGRSPKDAYIAGRKAQREKLEESKIKAPVLSRVAEVAGSAALPLGVTTKGAGLGAKVLRGAMTGGAAGLVNGWGATEGADPNGFATPSEQADGAVKGAAIGATIGGLTGAVGGVAGYAIDRAKKWANRAKAFGDMLDEAAAPPPAPQTMSEATGIQSLGQPIDRGYMGLGNLGKKAPTPRTREWPVLQNQPQPAPRIEGTPYAEALEDAAPIVKPRPQQGATRARLRMDEARLNLPKVTPEPPQGIDPTGFDNGDDLEDLLRRSLQQGWKKHAL